MFELRPFDDGLLGMASPLPSLHPVKSTRFPLALGSSSAFRLPLIADADHNVDFGDPVVKSLLRSTELLGEPSTSTRVALFDATPRAAEVEAAEEESVRDVWGEALVSGPAPVGLSALQLYQKVAKPLLPSPDCGEDTLVGFVTGTTDSGRPISFIERSFDFCLGSRKVRCAVFLGGSALISFSTLDSLAILLLPARPPTPTTRLYLTS